MKKIYIIFLLTIALSVFSNCHTAKKITSTTTVSKSTYESNLKTVIAANCTPCHIPAKGGFKKAYDNYASVKSDIDEMIRRIELNPTDKGFMPFKHAKLNDSTIAVFKQWRADGLMEK
jgi:nitrate/TMAO reductase-like tetraheme cytochrome c subunit